MDAPLIRLSGVIVLLIIWVVLAVLRGGKWSLKQFFLGTDGRPSSSIFQFFLWTVVFIYSYVSIFTAKYLKGDITAISDIPSNLLLAMGLSITTTVAAKAITSAKVNNNEVVKTDAQAPVIKPSAVNAANSPADPKGAPTNPTSIVMQPAAAGTQPVATEVKNLSLVNVKPSPAETGMNRLVLDDDGSPDLNKTQMLAWTFVAVGVYLLDVKNHLDIIIPYTGPISCTEATSASQAICKAIKLPDIDAALMVLMGLGQGAYLGTKLVTSTTPRLTNALPSAGDENTTITLVGSSLGARRDGSMVYIDGYPSDVVFVPSQTPAPSGDVDQSWKDTQITFRLPRTHPSGREWSEITHPLQLSVAVNGQISNSVQFTYIPPLRLTPVASLPSGHVNTAYAGHRFEARGGTPPYTWEGANLPQGLVIDQTTGVLSGTPTQATAADFKLQIKVTDGRSMTDAKDFPLIIQP
jgi:hypothetical protein